MELTLTDIVGLNKLLVRLQGAVDHLEGENARLRTDLETAQRRIAELAPDPEPDEPPTEPVRRPVL